MMKEKKAISINILSVLIILTTLLLFVIHPTGAWFSDSHLNEIKINATVANMKLQLFQITKDESNADVETEILTNIENAEIDQSDPTKSQYIELKGKISHDQKVELKLVLENNNKGKSAMCVKFKFELFVRGSAEDKLINTTIDGFVQPTATTKGFVKDADGFYYYKDSSNANAENALFERDTSVQLMSSFTVPYSSFADGEGNLILTNSDTIYIQLTVEAFEKVES